MGQASPGPQLPKELPSLEKEGVRTHLSNHYRHCPRQLHNAHGNSVVNRSPRPSPTTTRPLSSSAISISCSATCATPLNPRPALSAADPSTILLERSFLELTCPSVNLPFTLPGTVQSSAVSCDEPRCSSSAHLLSPVTGSPPLASTTTHTVRGCLVSALVYM